MRLTIVRHGVTDFGKKMRFQIPRSVLNAEGVQQVRAVAERLRDEHFAVAYVSDFARTQATAEEILRFHPETIVKYSRLLRERNTGIFRGKPREEFIKAQGSSGLTRAEFRPDGGESLLDAQQRVVIFYEKVAKRHQGQSVLFVSHGMVMTSLLLALLHRPFDEYMQFRFENTGVTVIEREDSGKHTLHLLNSTEHLDDTMSPRETVTE